VLHILAICREVITIKWRGDYRGAGQEFQGVNKAASGEAIPQAARF